MRGLSGAGSLFTQSVTAVEDDGLDRSQFQCQLRRPVAGPDADALAFHPGKPVEVPDIHPARRRPRQSRSGTADAVGMEEFGLGNVRDGEVGKIDIAYGPGICGGVGGLPDPLPEKCQLVTVAATGAVGEVAGEIPPFRSEGWMIPMVLGETPVPWLQGGTPVRGPDDGRCRDQHDEEQRDGSVKQRTATHFPFPFSGCTSRRRRRVWISPVPHSARICICG